MARIFELAAATSTATSDGAGKGEDATEGRKNVFTAFFTAVELMLATVSWTTARSVNVKGAPATIVGKLFDVALYVQTRVSAMSSVNMGGGGVGSAEKTVVRMLFKEKLS